MQRIRRNVQWALEKQVDRETIEWSYHHCITSVLFVPKIGELGPLLFVSKKILKIAFSSSKVIKL